MAGAIEQESWGCQRGWGRVKYNCFYNQIHRLGRSFHQKSAGYCWLRVAPRCLDIDAQMLPDCGTRQGESLAQALVRVEDCGRLAWPMSFRNTEVVLALSPPWLRVYSTAATVLDLVVMIASLSLLQVWVACSVMIKATPFTSW